MAGVRVVAHGGRHRPPSFTWSCFFGSAALCSATYSGIQMTGVHGRTVGVWMLLSCTLCFLCAFNHNKALRMATLLSFIYAYGYLVVYLVVEYLVHHSVPASKSRRARRLRSAIDHMDASGVELPWAWPPYCWQAAGSVR